MVDNNQTSSSAGGDQGDWQRPADSLPDEMWDVIVVGAGPAGASAAYRLARNGRRVLVLERARMPRAKPCGGAISALASSYLDFAIPEELIHMRAYGARVHCRRRSVELKLPEPVGVLVSRSEFDHFLAKKAEHVGAQVRYEAADELVIEKDLVALRTASSLHRARLAIIASGARSKLIQHVRRRDYDHEVGYCLQQDYPLTHPDGFTDLRGVIDIHFDVSDSGYCWLFHHGEYYSIGIAGVRSRMTRPLDVMRRFWCQLGLPPGDLRPRGGFVPCGGVKRSLVGPRAMLAGDAAGFVDPLFGEGISYAIRSGQLAAETANVALQVGDFSQRQLSLYTGRCRMEFERDLRVALFLRKLAHRYPAALIRLLAGSTEMYAKILSVAQGRLTYRRLLAYLLPRVAFLAARLLPLS